MKKQYSKPELTEFGTLSELTEKVGSVNFDGTSYS